jgi:hypothetical protein
MDHAQLHLPLLAVVANGSVVRVVRRGSAPLPSTIDLPTYRGKLR